jgi:localization factor PodJL
MQNKIAELARQLDNMCRGAEISVSTSRKDLCGAQTRDRPAASHASLDLKPEEAPPPAKPDSPPAGEERRAGNLSLSDAGPSPRRGEADEAGRFDRDAILRIENRLGALADAVERAVAGAVGARPADALSGQLDAMRREITERLDECIVANSRQAGELTALVRSVKVQGRPNAANAAMDALEREMARVCDRLHGADEGSASPDLHKLAESGDLTPALAVAGAGTPDRSEAHDRLPGLTGGFEPRLAKEIAALRIFQDEAGRGGAMVQETVTRAAGRLVRLDAPFGETGNREPYGSSPAPAPALAPARGQSAPRDQIEAVKISDETGGEFTLDVSGSGRKPQPGGGPVATGAEEILIEPGCGVPLSWIERELGPKNALSATQTDPGAAPSARIRSAELASDRSSNPAPPPPDTLSSGSHKRPVVFVLAAAASILGAYALAGAAAKRSGQSLSPAVIEEFAKKLFSAGPSPVRESRPETRAAAQRRGADAGSLNNADHSLLDPQFVEPWSLVDAEKPAPLKSAPGAGEDGAPKPAAGAVPMIPGAFENNGPAGEAANKPDRPAQETAYPSPAPGPNSHDQESGAEARAQFETGVLIARNSSNPQDVKVAAQYFEQAARQGLAVAQYRLAALIEKGVGVPRDMARAKALYRAAAEQGNTRAMHNLGVIAAEGDEGRPDYASAAIWFGKAAQAGVRDSQFNIAVLLARGLGAPRDPARAYVWFAILAAGGDAEEVKRRDDLATRLTSAELAAAKAAAGAFRPEPVNEAANERGATPAASSATSDAKPKVSGL